MPTSLARRSPYLPALLAAAVLAFAPLVGLRGLAEDKLKLAVDTAQEDPAARLEKTLAAKNEMAYLDTQLGDILSDLELRTRTNLELDLPALSAEGKNAETEFTFMARDITLASLLNQLLKQHGLTWVVENDAIIVTTEAGAAARLQIKPYSVAFLADAEGSIDFDELTAMLMQSVEPTSWRANGGSLGAIGKVSAKKLLLVTQTAPNHRAIAAVLKQLAAPRTPGTAKPAAKDDIAALAADHIEQEFDRHSNVQYLCTQLSDMQTDLELRHKLKIFLDLPALIEEGKGKETIINKTLKKTPLATVLALILHEQGLTWTVADEAIVITTPAGEAKLPTRIAYSVADFAGAGDESIDYDELTEIITQSVDPESWHEAGGAYGTISRVSGKQALVITQSYANHRKIQAILRQFAELKR